MVIIFKMGGYGDHFKKAVFSKSVGQNLWRHLHTATV